MIMNRFYVYTHSKLNTNEVFYIGKGSGNRAWSKSGRNNYWHNITNKYNYKVKILIKNLSEDEALLYERLGQMDLKPKANIKKCGSKGGNGGANKGLKWSEKAKKKHSLAMKNRDFTPWNKGTKKLIKSNSGSFTSKNTKGEKNPFYGKKHSQETKEKISNLNKKRKGEKVTKKALENLRKGFLKTSKPFICLETNEKFYSLSKAAVKLKISKAGISLVLNNKRKKCKGYTFTYIKSEEK